MTNLSSVKNEPLSSCDNCRFSKENEIDPATMKRHLQCIRNPPRTFPIQQQQGIAFMTVFPNVIKNMVCGEYQEKITVLQ